MKCACRMMRRGKVLSAPPAPNRSGSQKDHVMAKKSLPSPEVLRQLLRCEPETGRLFWLERATDSRNAKTWNARYAGKEAFVQVGAGGYKGGCVFNIGITAHRVVWAMATGEWPSGEIDHINGDTGDNRIVNLRDVPHSENLRNAKRSRANTSGVTGVSWSKQEQKWRATMTVCMVAKHLGWFRDFDSAVQARKNAAVNRFHENHGRLSS